MNTQPGAAMLKLLLRTGDKEVTQGKVVPVLPDVNASKTYDLTTFQDNIYQYHCCTDWPAKLGVVHPCWFATQALQLHSQLLQDKAQPFRVLGLVHVVNEMQVHAWLKDDVTVELACHFGQVWSHSRGYMFNVLTTVTQLSSDNSEQTPVMTIDSHYLARQEHVVSEGLEPYPQPLMHAYEQSQVVTTQLPLPNDLGKIYAKISGDYNPIHLHPLSAKLFGLKRHIAHGMWTKAKTFSAVAKYIWASEIEQQTTPILANTLALKGQFLQMLYLPGKVDIRLQYNGTEVLAWVVTPARPKPYFQLVLKR